MNQRIALTKALLKNALMSMLQEKSIYHLSIRDLCQRAGINRSTFYKYYGNQFDLLAEMEHDLLDDIETFLNEHSIRNIDALVQALQYLESNIRFVRLMINANVDPEFPGRLFSLSPIQRSLHAVIDPYLSEAEREYALNFLLFGGFQVVRMWINKEERESPEQLAALLTQHFFNTDQMRTPGGES